MVKIHKIKILCFFEIIKMSSNNRINSNVYLDWSDIENLVQKSIRKIKNKKYDVIVGITNGGIVPARLIAREMCIENINFIYMSNKKIQYNLLTTFNENTKYLIVDDIYDSGYTYTIVSRLLNNIKIEYDFLFLLSRYELNENLSQKHNIFVCNILNHDKWIIFPWEKDLD